MTGRCILVRHGTTALNAKEAAAGESAERVRGWKDVPLDADGLAQADEVAKDMAAGFDIVCCYSSDLSRAMETGRRIGRACGCPLYTDADLRPWNVGRWAGERVCDVLADMKRLVGTNDETPPGGETFSRFADRYLHRLRWLLREAKTHGGNVAVVTHTRNVQLTRAWLAAGAKDDCRYSPSVMNDYSNELGTGGRLEIEAA